jgi:predicted XRE-type DNA-binding protein
MGFPDRKEIQKALKKLEKAEGTLALSPSATPLEKLRWDICQRFIAYKISHQLNQKELAEVLGVDEAKMSKILRHRIEEFSTDRLINLYSSLDPEVSLEVG